MTNTKNTSKTIIAVVLTVIICLGLIFGLNSALSQKISENLASDSLGTLVSVLPQATSFTKIYESTDAESSSLSGVSATVTTVYQDNGGNGYVVEVTTSEGYTKEPATFLIGFDSEGKITGTEISNYPDTKDLTEDYLASYIGQDSALADVNLIAGVTYSSSAFKNAVEDAFACLIDNGMVSAGQKSDDQLLSELIPTVFPGCTTANGISVLEPFDVDSVNITSAMISGNGKGCAFTVTYDGALYLIIVNEDGSYKVYDTEGNEVSIDSSITDEAVSAADSQLESGTSEDKETKKLGKLLDDDAAQFEKVTLENNYTLVTSAYKITSNGNTYYGFVAKPFGYGNRNLTVYYVLDTEGKIVSMTADEFILDADYFSSYDLDKQSYKAGFEGLTSETYTPDVSTISGATITSDAINAATNAVFESFNQIKGGVE